MCLSLKEREMGKSCKKAKEREREGKKRRRRREHKAIRCSAYRWLGHPASRTHIKYARPQLNSNNAELSPSRSKTTGRALFSQTTSPISARHKHKPSHIHRGHLFGPLMGYTDDSEPLQTLLPACKHCQPHAGYIQPPSY